MQNNKNATTMINVQHDPYLIEINESCGLTHEAQVITLPAPAGNDRLLVLHDDISGELIPMQRSQQNPNEAFIRLAISPFTHYKLRLSDAEYPHFTPVTISDSRIVSNGQISLRLPTGITGTTTASATSGPIMQLKVADGPWRGQSFFDTKLPVLAQNDCFVEEGPLRVVFSYRVDFGTDKYYQATVQLDTGMNFAHICENFAANPGDQIVWDFAGADLPDMLYALDSTAGYTTRPLNYHTDQRMVRLFAWTQYQQLFDLSDGYAIRISHSSEVIGVVTLNGGSWCGNRLNHLEGWMRRWLDDDPESRRSMPMESKADTFPSPEVISARGKTRCTAHFNFEGWLNQGKRQFALVATTLDKLLPAENLHEQADPKGCSVALGHFEQKPDRPRYRTQQGLLRRIHIQHGMLPLAAQAGMTFEWPEEIVHSTFGYPHQVFNKELHDINEEQLTTKFHAYLQARVYGFWEGSGAAYSNCVVSRAVAPYIFYFEWLCQQGKLTPAEITLNRAHISFLSYLFDSDNYYPGLSTMQSMEDINSVEPTLEGMGNQNFYTDIINLFAVAAQIFPNHPAANDWREKFLTMWHRQLAYHVYPKSGVWEESHTYYQHVLITVLPLLLRLKADGVADEFANPAVQQLVGSALEQLTPRDAHYGGIRYLVPFGDHAVGILGTRYLYREYALAIAPHSTLLAANLAWAYREMGGEEALTITAVPGKWQSSYLQGLGYFFRNHDARGVESLLALRCGSAWAHHHNDDGSLLFYAHGRSVLVETALSESPAEYPKKYGTAGHNRWSLRDYEPINYLWRFNRGWISKYDSNGRFPFAVAYTPVFMVATAPQQAMPLAQPIAHYRTVIQLSATTFLVIDSGNTTLPQIIRFHIPGTQLTVNNDNEITANILDSCQLSIIPIGEYPCHTVLEQAASNKTEFVTTEVTFDIDTASCVAFLISADIPGTTTRLIAENNGWRVITEGVDANVQIINKEIRMTDLINGESQVLEIGK